MSFSVPVTIVLLLMPEANTGVAVESIKKAENENALSFL
jgi:hypothetical protein